MNKQLFEEYIQHPEELNSASLNLLEGLIDQFPYCQSAYLLYVKNLYNEKNIHFNQNLKIAAAYASDRKRMKHLILGEDWTGGIVEKKEEASIGEEEDTFAGLDLIEEVRRKILELKEEKQKAVPGYSIVEPVDDEDVRDNEVLSVPESEEQIVNKQLIDRFIEEEPRITPFKATFFDPSEIAKRSIIDDEDFVTETLAEIYLKQGNIPKAIKIYKQLSLKFPEKSSYFAAQIKNLKK